MTRKSLKTEDDLLYELECAVEKYPTDNATDANARLVSTVAQRDELLAALKALVEDYELLLGDGITDRTAPSLLNAANAAIAKAEGKR